jgi:hypothetical protein
MCLRSRLRSVYGLLDTRQLGHCYQNFTYKAVSISIVITIRDMV